MRMAAGAPPSRARRVRPRARARARPGLHPPRDLRRRARLAAAGDRRRGPLLVYNGEVYNHPELRAELAAAGERFETGCDTEVVLRLLAREGLEALTASQRTVRARAVGARAAAPDARPRPLRRPSPPLRGASPTVRSSSAPRRRRSSPRAASSHARTWRESTRSSPSGGRGRRAAAFADVAQVRPGGVVVWERGEIVSERLWWTPESRPSEPPADPEDLERLLRDSVRLRLRADVPVGAYLSGGLDSSLITAIAQTETTTACGRSRSRSVTRRYDERPPGGGRPGDRHRAPRARGRRRRDRRRAPRGDPPRRDAAHPHGPGADVPARPRGAPQRDHRGRDRRGSRRAVLGLRPVQGGRRSASSPDRARARSGDARPALPYLGPGGGAPRPGLAPVHARDR